MIVIRQLANRLWPGRHPIGQRARAGSASGRELTVVGVMCDAKFATIGDLYQMRAYLPLRQNYRGRQTLVVHARRAMCAASLPQPIPRSRTSVSRP